MKNTRDPFDDNLRDRLDNYSEEPDDKLWSGIASNIESVKPPVPWVKWVSITASVIIALSVLTYFVVTDESGNKVVLADDASSLVAGKDSVTDTNPLTSDASATKDDKVSGETKEIRKETDKSTTQSRVSPDNAVSLHSSAKKSDRTPSTES